MTFIRKNAWNQRGSFDNSDLLWYAKGVRSMQSRALDDPNSWWFFAAIHGEYITKQVPARYMWNTIPGPPAVPITPLPGNDILKKYWNQCQHQSWYFPPWHRGYLIALEAQIRSEVIILGGPEDWALPYWNYFGKGDEYKIPPAFTIATMPDGADNPLFVNARYGPNNDGNIYIDTGEVSQKCQENTLYTGSNPNTPPPGYGGAVTGFNHGQGDNGNLEGNPHNGVHTQIGGGIAVRAGLMSAPGTAGLDPIFYLHHCNIDRMWASWNELGNNNPTDQRWLNGPAVVGKDEFIMPMPDGSSWVFVPEELDDLSKVNYIYEDITTIPKTTDVLALRMSKFGIEKSEILQENVMALGTNSELVGANNRTLKLGGSGLKTVVKVNPQVWNNVSEKFTKASARSLPDHIYLRIENVTGIYDANRLAVSVNGTVVGHVSLFGLMDASQKEGHHGGSGLSFTLDITHVVDKLHLSKGLDVDALEVMILPNNIPENETISIGRLSIYREQL